jgi:hypothetical protein
MRIRVAVEDIEPDHWVAWALDLPACFSSEISAEGAIRNAPQKIAEHFAWLLIRDKLSLVVNEPIEVEVVETFHSFASKENPNYLVNGLFDDDRRALGYWDVKIALRLLDWTRQDLLSVLQTAYKNQYIKVLSSEARGSIAEVLNHIAISENWYFNQLGFGLEQSRLPKDALEKLAMVRANSREQLIKMIGDNRVTKNCDELWSGRKIMRRTLWHERDHFQQVIQLLTRG